MDQYFISTATENKIPALLQLVNSAYRGNSSRQGWTTEANLLDGLRVTEASLLQDINNPNAAIYTYYNAANEMLGCVFLEKKEHKLYVGMLSVSPILQNSGIGKILLQKAEQIAKEQNCITLTMTVISIRKELIDWYVRHGYKATGEIRPFFPTDNKVMSDEPLQFVVLEKKVG
jgi:ribosomal protein S18 acetylase RimI-like enzyme